ncbi:hypothetical protein V6N13_043902 [Hibiscus sabdariffa]
MQLSLSKNKLTCEIPEALSSCKNEFSGEAGKMEPLVQVNISHNHLTGALPSTGAFLVINETTVVGNDLCGGDFSSKKLKNRAWWVLIACSLAALLLLAVAAFGFLFINGRNNLELERAENEDRSIWELQFFDSTASKSITTDEGVVACESNADEGWVAADKIVRLPRQPSNLSFQQFSGYVPVDDETTDELLGVTTDGTTTGGTATHGLTMTMGIGCSAEGEATYEEIRDFK